MLNKLRPREMQALPFILVLGTCQFLPVMSSSPVVKAPAGTFRGVQLTTVTDNSQAYNAFRGIPYALPPVGNLRFRDPEPIQNLPSDEIYDATAFKSHCIQYSFTPLPKVLKSLGEDDCLYLNVYAPTSAGQEATQLKKVFVFVHGGGYLNGFTNMYNPGTLVVDQDIIVVVVAYRLGYLGFLSTKSDSCEGNFGLKDQLMSLSWIRDNIQAFGGDPDGVTLGGESAGGVGTSLLSLASTSAGLFSRAFPMSGVIGVEHNPSDQMNPKNVTIELARQLECFQDESYIPSSEEELSEMMDCLRSRPAEKFGANGTEHFPNMAPVVYGKLYPKPLKELFSDEEYLHSIKVYDREYLISFVHNEGDIFKMFADILEAQMTEEQKKEAPPDSTFRYYVTTLVSAVFGPVDQKILEKVVQHYQENHEFNALADFSADAIFHFPTMEWALAATKGYSSENSKVRILRFVHWPKMMVGPYKGINHGFDLAYLFDFEEEMVNWYFEMFQADHSIWEEEDALLKQKYIKLFGDFVKTGKPWISLGDELPFGWPGFDAEKRQYLEFGLDTQLKSNFRPDHMALWFEKIPQWIEEEKFVEEGTPKEEL